MSLAALFQQNVGRMECDLGTLHHFSDGLYAKEMRIPAGYVAGTHAHQYSHLSILASGRAIVRTDEQSKEYRAPACLEIKSSVHHTIEALEDCVWFCIHATDESDPDKVDVVLIEKGN